MKHFITAISIIYLSAIMIVLFLFSIPKEKLFNTVQANDILYTVQNCWPDIEEAKKSLRDYDVEYIVLGLDGEILGASTDELAETYTTDMLYHNRIADIKINSEISAKILFIDNQEEVISQIRTELKLLCITVISVFFLIICSVLYYFDKELIRPAQMIHNFTKNLTDGNYDMPMPFYDSKLLGMFSSSFDIMREELLALRKKEQRADQNRREVIAAISHDIKNPVASIQAIAEYQFYTTDQEEIRKEFGSIIEKTNQINYLIENLHTSAMNELEHLTINLEEEESFVVQKTLLKADYKHQIQNIQLPECLLLIDKIRLQQMMDNIISNSYKYANTRIEVTSNFEDRYLCVCIRDFGGGVLEDEEVFLTQKYFRGENAKNKEGSGIGLYITQYLAGKMDGKISCHTKEEGGFEVKLYLKLA